MLIMVLYLLCSICFVVQVGGQLTTAVENSGSTTAVSVVTVSEFYGLEMPLLNITKEDLIEYLDLIEHVEGGYFSETYRANYTVETDREGEDRNILTSIYYLLTDNRPIGHFHKNLSDIIHYFQLGSPITYLVISPSGKLQKYKLGANIFEGEQMQLLVPGGYWKASVLEEGEYGLLGESVAPGFDYQDMELATIELFEKLFPNMLEELAPYVKV